MQNVPGTPTINIFMYCRKLINKYLKYYFVQIFVWVLKIVMPIFTKIRFLERKIYGLSHPSRIMSQVLKILLLIEHNVVTDKTFTFIFERWTGTDSLNKLVFICIVYTLNCFFKQWFIYLK